MRSAPVSVIRTVSANTLPVSPFFHFGSKKSMLKANTIPGLSSSPIALIAPLVCADGVMPIARIFERTETMTMDASLAHPETAPENSLLHRLYGGRHLLSRPEQQKPCAICLYAPLIDG